MTLAILDMAGYNWPTCIMCLAGGVSLIVGYWIWEVRKVKK